MTGQLIAETTDCDFKEAVERAKPKSWLKSVSAFTNTKGGALVFGVTDGGYDFCVTLWNMNYTDQVSPQVSPQVAKLLNALGNRDMSAAELMEGLGFSDRKSFRENYLAPALESGLVERTIPDKPNSRL